MTALGLRLRDSGEVEEFVDLDRLTPRARALAQTWAQTALRTRGPVVLRSHAPQGEIPGYDPLWHGDPGERHSLTFWSWADYPDQSALDPHDYIESEARKLPVGYAVEGLGPVRTVPAYPAEDDEWLTSGRVLEVARLRGRAMHPSTWRSYVARGEAPPPGRHVGRTPQWRRAQIETWLQGGERRRATGDAPDDVPRLPSADPYSDRRPLS